MNSLQESISYLSYVQLSRSALIYILVLLGLIFARVLIINRIAAAAQSTKTEWDDAFIAAIKRIGWPVYVVTPLFVVTKFVILPTFIVEAIGWLVLIVVTIYGALSIEKLLTKVLKTVLKHRAQANGEKFDKTVAHFSILILKIVLWALVLLIILQNLGYEISALLGGLGILGITLGFALQSILGDIFAFFSIYLDKPFVVGDFIIVDDKLGTVQKIGIKTTRIQSLQGEEVILSNRQLTETALNNFKKMDHRRVNFSIGIEYETPLNKVKQVPEIIEKICTSIDDIEFNQATLSELADSSLNFEVTYHVKDSDYVLHREKKQQIYFGILEEFEKANISIAYPTQRVLVSK